MTLSNRRLMLTGVVASIAGLAGVATAQPFIGDITRWTDQDALDPYEPGAVVFIGSSSIRRWEQLTRDFPEYRIIQRGFGGAQFEHVNQYVDDIVLPYQPSAIVIWAGTNDLSTGETAAEVFGDYQTFVGLVLGAQPNVDIFYLGVTPTTANGPTTAERDAFNALVEAESAGNPRLHYVDLPTPFYALNPPSGPDFQALYVDAIHLNRAGYDLWTTILRPQFTAEVAPNKSTDVNPDTLALGERLLFDFGPSNPEDGDPTPSPDANGNHWNNWHPAEGSNSTTNPAINAGEHIGDLVDTTGRETGIGLEITGGFLSNGKVNGGLLSPSAQNLGDLAIATATQDYFFFTADGLVGGGNDDIPGGLMLTGLDPDRAYEIGLFASRVSSQTRVTEFAVFGANSATIELQTSGVDIGADGAYNGNDSTVARVTVIRPNEFGEIFIDGTLVQGDFAYLALLELKVVGLSVAASPEETIVEAGGTITMDADVEGADAPFLRWHRDGEPLFDSSRVSGATTETLTISPAGGGDAGVYTLVATDGTDTVETDGAIAAVRASAVGPADINNDGTIDVLDVLDIINAVDAAP
ncbi:MAG: GDSL-type esterase/lipase family protein [Planctomycetota bacterium]